MPPVEIEPKISAGEWPAASRLLRFWVQFPPGAWIFVCCEYRVLSGRGLCDELITRPEESYRLCCVLLYDLETSRMGAPYIYDISRLRVKLCQTARFSKCSDCTTGWSVHGLRLDFWLRLKCSPPYCVYTASETEQSTVIFITGKFSQTLKSEVFL